MKQWLANIINARPSSLLSVMTTWYSTFFSFNIASISFHTFTERPLPDVRLTRK
nr:hypothetical protein [Halalkalibacter okhensis]